MHGLRRRRGNVRIVILFLCFSTTCFRPGNISDRTTAAAAAAGTLSRYFVDAISRGADLNHNTCVSDGQNSTVDRTVFPPRVFYARFSPNETRIEVGNRLWPTIFAVVPSQVFVNGTRVPHTVRVVYDTTKNVFVSTSFPVARSIAASKYCKAGKARL